MKILEFSNVEEIKFTKVGKNTFSISIKSDIVDKDKSLKNTTFEANLCTIDSNLVISCNDEYSYYNIGEREGMSKSYSIPMDIHLLVDRKTNNLYTITVDD